MTPARSVRLARALWIVWAVAVWNVIFDRTLVLAGRRYVYTAYTAAEASHPAVRAEPWMREAISRGFWLATGAGALIVIVGMALIALAARRLPRSSNTIPTRG